MNLVTFPTRANTFLKNGENVLIRARGDAPYDNRLGSLRTQGGYLYDKGENDELFHFSCPQLIYKYILS